MTLSCLINKYFAILGISKQQMRTSYTFNARILMAFLVNGLCVFSSAMYITHGVNNSVEFVECLYSTSSATASAVALAIIIWKLENFFKFLNDFENVVGKSE